MNKTAFISKPHKEDLIPKTEFIIEKTIVLTTREFDIFLNDLMEDYQFIADHTDLMYEDDNGVWHCILITSADASFGILVQSEGYSYARYAATYMKVKGE